MAINKGLRLSNVPHPPNQKKREFPPSSPSFQHLFQPWTGGPPAESWLTGLARRAQPAPVAAAAAEAEAQLRPEAAVQRPAPAAAEAEEQRVHPAAGRT